MKHTENICREMETKLPDLLLDPETASVETKAHVEACEGCRNELDELRATLGVLDNWVAPEPNPFFMTRFQVKLQEEKAAPAGWFARVMASVRAPLAFGPHAHTRPLVALALTLVVLLGGGTYLDVYWQKPATPPAQTAVVHDLQTLDNNAQLLDQLAAISGDQQ